jgi:type IV pilus assembly protein PilM
MSVLSAIQKIFPPPSSITLHSVGVDISDTSLKYIGFERTHHHDAYLNLTTWGDIEVPEGVVERGNVHDIARLTEALKMVKKQSRAEYISVSLPEERAYLFETTVAPGLSHTEMRAAIEFHLEENVPLSPRDAYFDYTVIGADDETGELRIVVAAYAQATINSYYEACIGAELVPLSFEIEAQAIARASIPAVKKGAYMIVDFGKTRMGVGIVFNGVLMYTSTIDIAGSQLSDIMRSILGDRPESEYTMIKNTKGIVMTEDNKQIAQALLPVVDAIADELTVRMHYWHTRKIDRGERQITEVLLCGGSANLRGLCERLQEKTQIPTRLANVWENAFPIESVIPPITRRYSYGYATAIGLALRTYIDTV